MINGEDNVGEAESQLKNKDNSIRLKHNEQTRLIDTIERFKKHKMIK